MKRRSIPSRAVRALTGLLVAGGILGSNAACTPRVEVTAPEKPITINLNVKIDHEVRVRVDRELDKVLSKESGLF
ncbi:MAG: YnbE family lipoprotein [Nitrospira sp.]|nr:YnbE family lipoprotein [Nitrospira sp.]MCP9461179.1 YnbE family lipoprotein [Nitrospira sp.]MCP9475429.1 YnbE family lipoprotein [Nitrospira sp.]